jgi:predicted ATPase with chaperone activity
VFLTLIHKFNLDEEFLLGELEEKGEIKKEKMLFAFWMKFIEVNMEDWL